MIRSLKASALASFGVSKDCKLCGRKFKTFDGRNRHIENYHGLSIEEYRAALKRHKEAKSSQSTVGGN